MVNNPPAFPSHYEILHREMIEGKVLKVLKSKDGMTIRDYFAAQVILGAINEVDDAQKLAKLAYVVADAFLKEREKQNGQG